MIDKKRTCSCPKHIFPDCRQIVQKHFEYARTPLADRAQTLPDPFYVGFAPGVRPKPPNPELVRNKRVANGDLSNLSAGGLVAADADFDAAEGDWIGG